MPLDEEGNKWSCEPCVRGHRSSKCQHFDRMMMKVPKAGRPLAKCPHPKGTCSCQKLYAFMVRIPKGSTCLCRPLYKVPMVVTETGQTAAPESTTPAIQGPVPAAQASPNVKTNRVQKRTKRQNSGRSLPDVSTKDLEAWTNVAAEQGSEITPAPDLASPATWNSSYNTPYTVSAGPSTSMHQPSGPYDSAKITAKAASPPPQISHAAPAGDEKKSNCCCGKSAPHSPPKPVSSGCSKDKSDATITKPPEIKKEDTNATQSWPHAAGDQPTHGAYPGAPQMPMNMNSSPAVGFSHPPAVPAPPLATSISAPVTGYSSPTHPPQWGSSSYMSGPQGFQVSGGPYSHDIYGMQGDPAHACNCGEGCQCLGCASHPYNDTTLQHIQEMGYMMATGEDDRSVGSPGDNTDAKSPSFNEQHHHHHQQQHPNSTGYSQYIMNNHHPPDQSYANNFDQSTPVPGADPLHHMPGLGPQPQGETAMMQPSAYFTVEYPVNFLDPCTNMSGTCQCGINCACVGCLTHHGHNGLPLEPSPPPDNVEFPASNLQMSESNPQTTPPVQMPMYPGGSNDYHTNPS